MYHMQICTFVYTCELYFSCLCVSVTYFRVRLLLVFTVSSLLHIPTIPVLYAPGCHHSWKDKPVLSAPHVPHLSFEFSALVLQTQATMPDCLHQAWGSEPRIFCLHISTGSLKPHFRSIKIYFI